MSYDSISSDFWAPDIRSSHHKSLISGVAIGAAIGLCVGALYYRRKIRKATEEIQAIDNEFHHRWTERDKYIKRVMETDLFYDGAYYDEVNGKLDTEKATYKPLLGRYEKISNKLNRFWIFDTRK
jgi:hypothetical protein